jgi:hypothetical protein
MYNMEDKICVEHHLLILALIEWYQLKNCMVLNCCPELIN